MIPGAVADTFTGECNNCGSERIEYRDDSDQQSGYSDPERPWCRACCGWAD